MRHLSSKRRLGLSSRSHKKAMMSSMTVSLVKHKRIKTTHARAMELRRFVEPLITFAKRGDLHARRQVLRKIQHKETVAALFNEVAPAYADRPGGYTRVLKLGFRDNDRAEVSIIELVDLVGAQDSGKKSKEKKSKEKNTKQSD
ncbi:MAG: 50S ribosomal protein L17 [Fidelibacterota bacterium]